MKEDTWHLPETIESIPQSKYGVTLDGMLGDRDTNSFLMPPTQHYAFESEDIWGVADYALRRKFYGELTLERISLPYMSSIGEQGMSECFFDCPALSSVDFSGLTSIGLSGLHYAFANSQSITTVDFSSLREISSYGMYRAFASSTSLTSIDLEQLTSLGTYGLSYTFYGCTSLQSVCLSSLTSIPAQSLYSAFQNCTSLKTVHLTKLSNAAGTLQNALTNAFNGCTSLELVDFSQATAVPTLANINAFGNTNSTYKIVVPDALYDTWIATARWSDTSIKPHIVKASEYQP